MVSARPVTPFDAPSAPVVQVPGGGPIAARPSKTDVFDGENFFPAALGGTARRFPFFTNTQFFADTDLLGDPLPKPPGTTNMPGAGGSLPRGWYVRVFGVQCYISSLGVGPLTAAQLDDKRKLWDTAYWQLNMGSTPYMSVPFHRIPTGSGITGNPSTTQIGTTIGDYQMGVPIVTCYFDLTVPTKICRDVIRQREVEVEIPDFQASGAGGKRLVCIEVEDSRGPSVAELEKACAAAYAKSPAQRQLVMRKVKRQVREQVRQCDVRVPRTPIEFAETENFSVDVVYPVRPVLATAAFPFRMTMNLVSVLLRPLA